MQNNLCPQCQSPIPADAPGGICPGCALLGVSLPTSPTQVAAASVPMLDEVAAAFPELEVLELYGQGGMGAVFKARQPKLDRFVALKILTPALATQPGFAERFTREARALAKLSHPNIVGVHDFGESGGFFYLLMEFVDGVNLRQAMRAGVTPEQALLLVPKVCEALQFAHDHGVLHRDIKPENILLDTHGVPKLADFGIAKFGDDKSTGLTQSGAQLGTAAYMAPEQIEQPATVDHRADIYSLGVDLYEMLTGELPLGRFAAPSEKSHCSGGVDDVVLRALEKQRERRQQSATEMKTQVESASTSVAQPPREMNAGPVRSRAAFWSVVLGLPAAIGAFIFGIAIGFPTDRNFTLGPAGGLIFTVLCIVAVSGWVLGLKAIADIRKHCGHLTGTGIALAVSLALPVMFSESLTGWRGAGAGIITMVFSAVAIAIYPRLKRRIDDGEKGVPLPPRTPVSLPALATGFVVAAFVVLAVGSMWESYGATKRAAATAWRTEAENEMRQTESELATAEAATKAAATGEEISSAKSKVQIAHIRIAQSKRHLEAAESSDFFAQGRNGVGRAQTLSFAMVAAMLVGCIFLAISEHRHPAFSSPAGVSLPKRADVSGRPSLPPPSRDAPFSKAAAAGALLAIGSIPFGFIVFLIVKATISASLDTQGQLQGPVAGNIIIFGFIPAFIGVALGWKAVGDFRYHRGHLRGGGTAVFAALGLPVLALILTALTNFEDIDRAINPIRIGSAGTLVACLVVLAAFAASIWAVLALWRFVHSGPPGVPVPQRPVHHVQPSSIPTVTGVPFEYRSPRQWLGMPLVHIVRGRDPLTGKIPVARGVIAIGARAHGIIAVGVIASGGLAIGTIAFGVISIGALAVGIFAGGALAAGVLVAGSLSIGFVSAIGALAIGDIAKGSLAIGRFYTEGVTRIQLDSLWRIGNGLLLVAIGAWSAMVPGFRVIRRTTDASRPWSPASFRAVIGTLILLALILVTFFVPNLPTFQAARPVPPSFTVAFPGDVIRPGSQGMVVTTAMPYDYMVEYTFFIRDAEGTVEIPQLGCTFAARNPPASNNGNGKPRIPIEAKWALKPADASSSFPYLRFEGSGTMPANSGWWRSGSGTYNLAERFRKFRWEPHPERPKQTPLINFGIVPFIRGTGMNGTEPVGAEMFLRVEARPLSVNEPVPEYTVFDNATREQRQQSLLTDYARAERNPEYIKRKAELATLQARLKEVGETSAEAASLKRDIQKASNRANYLRTELATPQPGEYLKVETPELVAVKIEIAGLLAKLRDFDEEPPTQPANKYGTRTIIVPEEIEAVRKELDAARAERSELLKKAKDIQWRRVEQVEPRIEKP